MIRTEDCLPRNYINESRDFQALCRVLDFPVNMSLAYAENLNNNLITLENTIDRVLPLIAIKLGLFTYYKYPSNILRAVLRVFPEMIRNKGTEYGIVLAVRAFIASSYTQTSVRIEYGESERVTGSDKYTIVVEGDSFINSYLLEDLLSYVAPTGVFINVIAAKLAITETERMIEESSTRTIMINSGDFREARSVLGEYKPTGSTEVDTNTQQHIGTVGLTELAKE